MLLAKQVYLMLGNEDLWQAAEFCDAVLRQANLPYSICGGVAVCLHGYQRNTTDIDLIIKPDDQEAVSNVLVTAGFTWDDEQVEFRSASGIALQCLISGERAGKDTEVKIPEPLGDANVEIREGLSVVRLSRLIEMKLASGQGNLRRTHKDFADVVELIAIRKLDGSFASLLHKSLRKTFGELVRNANS